VNTPDPALALIDRFWDDLLRLQPLRGTYVGDHRHDGALPDPSPSGRADVESVYTSAQRELASIDRSGVTPSAQPTLEILEAICEQGLRSIRARLDLWEVASHMEGPATTLAEVASIQQADTPEALERYEARLHAFPAYLRAWEEVGREGIAAGVVAPRVVVERSVAMLDRTLRIGPADSPAMAPVNGNPGARERVERAIREAVDPAHARFRDFLRETYLPAAPDTSGLVGSPDAQDRYATAIAEWTSLDLAPDEVHALGVDRLRSIDAERARIATGLGYPDAVAAVADRTARGENVVTSEAELLALVEDQVARSWEAAPSFFGRVPAANCQVRPVEAFRAAETPFAFYNPPTEDGSRPGIYYVNAFEVEHRPKHHLAGVTFHEANPGHHFQIALEMQMPDRHPLRKFGGDLAGGAFAEGWGLYAERLADEMGLYADEWERLGLLENQAHRAARLVVDTGLHHFGWTRERAIAQMIASGLHETDAAIEVDRYIAMPAQALCYMIGMIEIERAREIAMSSPGASLQAFHDEVLALGQVPLPAFRRAFGSG